MTYTYKTMADVKEAVRLIGNHWFDKETMRFFNCRIESRLLRGSYFVTSERQPGEHPRLFSVRQAQPDGSIQTIGKFQEHKTLAAALEAVAEIETDL
jgi:hypothetical protein